MSGSSERGREARDNGYHIFAYLNREHPELNSWFVADPTLPDYERVQALGRVVPYRSWKHYLLCAASEMKISTHVLGYTPEIDSSTSSMWSMAPAPFCSMGSSSMT